MASRLVSSALWSGWSVLGQPTAAGSIIQVPAPHDGDTRPPNIAMGPAEGDANPLWEFSKSVVSNQVYFPGISVLLTPILANQESVAQIPKVDLRGIQLKAQMFPSVDTPAATFCCTEPAEAWLYSWTWSCLSLAGCGAGFRRQNLPLPLVCLFQPTKPPCSPTPNPLDYYLG